MPVIARKFIGQKPNLVQPAKVGEGHFVVVSHPPRLSVEAEGVELPQVLQAMGAKVGFAVVDKGVSRQVLTISMKDATLEEILRRVLRSENHAIIYRGGVEGRRGGTIDRILLFGPQAYAEDPPDPRNGGRFRSVTRTLPSDTDKTLAMTTRQAQQNLKALIDGLETARRSWLDSSADERR